MLVLGHQSQGGSCVPRHPFRIAPSPRKLGAEQGDRGRQLGHHPRMGGRLQLPLSACVVEGALGLGQEPFGRAQAAEVELHHV